MPVFSHTAFDTGMGPVPLVATDIGVVRATLG